MKLKNLLKGILKILICLITFVIIVESIENPEVEKEIEKSNAAIQNKTNEGEEKPSDIKYGEVITLEEFRKLYNECRRDKREDESGQEWENAMYRARSDLFDHFKNKEFTGTIRTIGRINKISNTRLVDDDLNEEFFIKANEEQLKKLKPLTTYKVKVRLLGKMMMSPDALYEFIEFEEVK
ncbi:hypothetical protein [Tepidibacter hydrothermalis]|uniref:Lipoprotein n=1 Tax=Tepidibacter hydrothermalis TaxID=3036126 RepID=A0ABY8E9Y0_9FIRM|nr:hypothetical protein [Tepidibacter hydrothermalis]WFD09743.1 hypothetical protein P4S50_15300 [Tepidibacter hydrothermalis]